MTPALDNSRNRAVALSVMANAASIAMAGLASVLVARILGPLGRGRFAAIVVSVTLACALGDLGLSQSCTYFSARRRHAPGQLMGTAVGLSLAAGTFLLLLLESCAFRLWDPETAAATRIYFLSIPLTMAVTCLGNLMLGLGLLARFNLIKTLQAAAYLAGVLAAWKTGSVQVTSVLQAILLCQVLAALCAFACAADAVPLSAWRVSRAAARDLLSYGMRTYFGALCWLANGRIDQALLACLAPLRDLGIYAVAVSYSGIQLGVSGAIATVAFSRVAQASSSQERRHEFRRSLQLFALLTVPLALLMACLARFGIPLVYGAAFASAWQPACILLLGGLFLGVNYLASNCLRAQGRPGLPGLAEAAGLLVTLAALPFALRRWGIGGAAIVSVASYAATTAALASLWNLRLPPVVTHFQRRPFGHNFSIERVFATVRRALPPSLAYRVAVCPYNGTNPFKLAYNLFSALRRQSRVNHITGDIAYLAWLLPARRTILTVHDCVGMIRLRGWRRRLYRWLWLSLPARRCALLTVISAQTKRELIAYTGCTEEKIRVVPDPVGPEFQPSPRSFCAARPVVLQVGTGFNKNIGRVAQALRGIRCELHIVGALRDQDRLQLDQNAIRYRVSCGLSDQAMVHAYQTCDLVIFASAYEGFGMPIVEANAVGRPVVTSNIEPMTSVARDAACFVDHQDPASIRRGVLRVIRDPAFRESLVRNGWQNVERFRAPVVAAAYAALYRELAPRQHSIETPSFVRSIPVRPNVFHSAIHTRPGAAKAVPAPTAPPA